MFRVLVEEVWLENELLKCASARRAASLQSKTLVLLMSSSVDVALLRPSPFLVNNIKSSQKSLFRVKRVHVKVEPLKFSIRDSRHNIPYNTLPPLATGRSHQA
ncbi:hypothetical protein CPB86DRAFT_369356 [Serendipita vermifera]|nr:hypothetical protein CPB86DRAFT_369356 [Serendipita vermifera]